MEYIIGVLVIVAVAIGVSFYVRNALHAKDVLYTELKSRYDDDKMRHVEAQGKVERLLSAMNQKDVFLERGAQALEMANKKLIEQEQKIKTLSESVIFQEAQYKKLIGQKKSSEVRTGKITEQISPFLEEYPASPSTARFIGDPIDFVHFEQDKVLFVEVKSGKSQLNTNQRRIRDLISEGKVEFTIYRVEGK